MVKVKYIGPDDSWSDSLYNSGATWTKGSVVAVPKEIAEKLLLLPEFEAAPFAKKFVVAEPVKAKVIIEEPPLVNLGALNKEQLSQFAHRNFGVIIPKKETIEAMRNTIRLQMGMRYY